MRTSDMHDIVIIGAGPAGLTAAIYARRAGKTVLLLEKENFGGQITQSPKVENYPAFNEISGIELADRMLGQATALGADIELDEATGIDKTPEGFTVKSVRGSFDCRAVIVATGSKHRELGLEREEEFVGNGISYCAVCDGAFYADCDVAVIGGGNSALQDAVLLSERCKSVTVVQNLAYLTGEVALQKILSERGNVKIVCNSVATKLMGESKIDAVEITDTISGQKSILNVDGIFVAIGQKPENSAFSNMVSIDDRGYIIADETCTTMHDGIFTAGDCRTKNIRQITTAASDGATAAIAACMYIDRT